MHVLIEIALKSLTLSGLTLGLLQLMKGRCAAERSWVAHIGLLSLIVVAFAPLVLPSWNVETPALFASAAETPSAVHNAPSAPVGTISATAPVAKHAATVAARPLPSLGPVALATALYAVPAAILLFITLLALGRLIALRAHAEVLVDG